MTCKDCVHYDLCRSCSRIQLGWHGNSVRYVENIEEICKDFKARSQFVELPCKVGDDAYCIYHGKIERSGVTSICIGSHYTGIVIYTVQFSFTAEDIGKFIFFSVEEAEKALKEREENV